MALIWRYLILGELFKKAGYNAKITEIKGQIPSITGSATTDALNTVVKNKIVSDLVKRELWPKTIRHWG